MNTGGSAVAEERKRHSLHHFADYAIGTHQNRRKGVWCWSVAAALETRTRHLETPATWKELIKCESRSYLIQSVF